MRAEIHPTHYRGQIIEPGAICKLFDFHLEFRAIPAQSREFLYALIGPPERILLNFSVIYTTRIINSHLMK
jgi:hypothetical protein